MKTEYQEGYILWDENIKLLLNEDINNIDKHSFWEEATWDAFGEPMSFLTFIMKTIYLCDWLGSLIVEKVFDSLCQINSICQNNYLSLF